LQRKTYALIHGDVLTQNVLEIRKKYPLYQYYFGVVKNNAYHHGMKCVLDLKKGGINYFAVSSLEEALGVRKYLSDTPILCLEPIDLEFLDDVINFDITMTVDSLEYLEELLMKDIYSKLKIHLKIDSGMHRLGFDNKEDFMSAIRKIKECKNLYLEGIYSHFATSGITDSYWDKQVSKFLEITEDIDFKEIPIVHFGRSKTLVNHEKLSFCNGIRLGICMYGFAQSEKKVRGLHSVLRKGKRRFLQIKNKCSKTFLENDLSLSVAFSLYSTVISKRKVKKGDVIGYDTKKVKKDGFILTIPIGYADGVTKEFQKVFILGKYYSILTDCMDMLLVFSEDDIPLKSKVELIGENIHLNDVCVRCKSNAYHLLNQISNRVVRVHQSDDEIEEIYY